MSLFADPFQCDIRGGHSFNMAKSFRQPLYRSIFQRHEPTDRPSRGDWIEYVGCVRCGIERHQKFMDGELAHTEYVK